MINIILVDDHTLFRKGLRMLLEQNEGVKVIGEASDGALLLKMSNLSQAEILIADIQMPNLDGFGLLKVLQKTHPLLKIMVISQFASEHTVLTAICLGAKAYMTKNIHPSELYKAITMLRSNQYYISNEIGPAIRSNAIRQIRDDHGWRGDISLTVRELEIIMCACRGMSSSQMSKHLNLNVRTVENHRQRIMDKIGVNNFTAVIIYTLKNYHIAFDRI